MSLFNKSQYVYLANSLRDHLIRVKTSSSFSEESKKMILIGLEYSINHLSIDLETENPRGFNKSQFLHNIYCGKSHLRENCLYGYIDHNHIYAESESWGPDDEELEKYNEKQEFKS